MKKVLGTVAVLAALVAAPIFAAEAGSWTGWITDSHCGAKGASTSHKDCGEKCVKGGATAEFYNPADKKLYKLDNQDLAKQHFGHEVTVKGTVDGDSIKVESIEPAAAK